MPLGGEMEIAMTPQRIIGLILLIVGIGLLIVGMNASHSLTDQVMQHI